MPTPCSSCRRSGRRCLVDLGSGNCAECLSRNAKCDLVVTARDWANLNKLQDGVQADLAQVAEDEADAELDAEEVERALEAIQKRLQAVRERKRTLRERRIRLRQKANLLTSREREMFARELASIEEMEKLEAEAGLGGEDRPPTESGESSGPGGLPDGLDASGLSPVPSELLGMDIPADWSFSQLLHTGDNA